MDIKLCENSVVLNRTIVKKLCCAIDSIGRSMTSKDLMEISLMSNSILIETEDIQTIIKLEYQD